MSAMKRSWMMAMAVLGTEVLVGCSGGNGGGGSLASDSPSPFDGTCAVTAGGDTTTCGTETTTHSYVGQSLVISGSVSEMVSVAVDSGCTVDWDVEGETATVKPAQACAPFAWTSATMTLDGDSITIIATGVTSPDGVACTIQQNYTCVL